MRSSSLRLSLTALLVTLASSWPARADAPSTPDTPRVLADAYWAEQLRHDPEGATFLGHHDADDRLDDLSDSERARHLDAVRGLAERLARIDRAELSPEEQRTAAVLDFALGVELDGARFHFERTALDALAGPQVAFFDLLENSHPRRDAHDLDTLLARCHALPRKLADYETNLRAGLAAGRTAPRVVVERVLDQLRALPRTPPSEHPLTHVADTTPRLTPPERDRYRRAVTEALADEVYPTFARLRGFLERTYLPKARGTVGLSALPDGKEAYAFLIHEHTTTRRTPAALHQLGLDELRRTEDEERRIAAKLAPGKDLRAFAEEMRRARSSATAERKLAQAREILERTRRRLPEVVGRQPSIGLEVAPMPAALAQSGPAAYYNPPTEDGSRPGKFYVNLSPAFLARPDFLMAALAAHEGLPGHHLQIALAYDRKDLPSLRRYGENSAFVEGWALYAERLVDELGLYRDERERYGMLSNRAWRACRLVVDTGLHALGWSRRRALDFLVAHSALPRREAETEVDRYITWPAQALAYMVGEQEILAARDEARAALGERYTPQAFHDVVLDAGPLPLEAMRAEVRRWIAEQRASSTSTKEPAAASRPAP